MARVRRQRQQSTTRFSGTKTDLLLAGDAVCALRYSRASSDPRGTKTSVTDQDADNLRRVRQASWRDGGSFMDNDASAGEDAPLREGYDGLAEHIRAQGDVLVMWDISRAQRDMDVYRDMRKLCLSVGLFFWMVRGVLYDLRDHNDELQLDIGAAVAAWQARSIKMNVRLALTERAKAGKPHGKCPFGMTRTYDPHTRKMVSQKPDEDWRVVPGTGLRWQPAEVVRWIFDRLLKRWSLRRIAEQLNEQGIPCPRLHAAMEEGTPLPPAYWLAQEPNHKGRRRKKPAAWTDKTVREIALNPAYIGQRWHCGELAKEASWAPLLADESVFLTVENWLLDPRRRTGAGPQQQAKYLCSGVGACGPCGNGLTRRKNRTGGKDYAPVYGCSSRHGCVACDQATLDLMVTEWVLYRLAAPGVLDDIRRRNATANVEVAQWRAKAQRLRAKLRVIEARLNDVDDEGVEDEWEDLQRRKKALRRGVEEADQHARRAGLAAQWLPFADAESDDEQAILGIWEGLDLATQRNIISDLVLVKVWPAGRGRQNVPLRSRVEFVPLA